MWNSIPNNVRISFFIFIILAFLGFFSLGAVGFGLYYLIFPVAGFFFHILIPYTAIGFGLLRFG
ncbi:hypothetical protein LEP1GSC151_2068 [Leptospira interrogans serovar Grippotyphosa str. LT2186]|uniref:Uncharacterized protein n=2 Tax=Leptospira interrogans TaxID=173 RepID=M7A2B9_LEPIR|nr:hypothetical protein LEP1GSC151_2068 [Leptospira interrogans serovar Grippotyphosa str. LT2186]EMN69423.1 hypothetical protein LEP1GSC100_0965 [Leptospira interrogans serovar Bataviae str. UI 08561]EMP08175.1 hypothetical protein LEP1GSC124_0941 [Leptospira interrogans serovar Pyrogenes str. 200701872]